MITGVEICKVVTSSVEALELYERIFDVERVEVSDFGIGKSEVVFNIFGSRFHLLDENHEHMLFAPKQGDPIATWTNVAVPDIQKTFDAAMAVGCTQVSPVNDMPAMGVKNAIFVDKFNHLWMLHQIDRIVSHEERMEIFKNSMN
ncbi:MAG: VOC family protein [Defluviitaleaceae bacterium]|nr:VOC family protein [Defluviitaleaceae bacterium]